MIEFLRQFRFGGLAVFDFVASFLGIYLLAPWLSKIFLKFRIYVPRKNWLFLTLPMSIFIHVLAGEMTLMTRDFLDMNGYYFLKVVVIGLFLLGLRGIRVVRKTG